MLAPVYTRVQPLLPALFWLAAAFALVMALLPNPPHVLPTDSDKVQHMVAFGVLALLAGLAWPAMRLRWIGLGLAGFGGLIELAQLIPALNRSSDSADWLADMLAILAMLVAIRLARWIVGARHVAARR